MVIVEAGEGRGRASRGGSAGSKGKQRSVAIFTGVSHSHKSLNSRIRALGTGNYKTITDNWAEYIHERATGSTGRQRSCFPPKGPLKQEPLVDVTIWGCRCWDWFVPLSDLLTGVGIVVSFSNPLARTCLGGKGDETIFASNQSISKLL